MSNTLNNSAVTSSPTHTFSVQRVLLTLVPLILIVLGGAYYFKNQAETVPNVSANKKTAAKHLAAVFSDADHDLVADAPTDPTKLLNPETLFFSYIGAKNSELQEQVWKEFVAALSKSTGKNVEFVVFKTTNDQLSALKHGKLHITAFSTGTVPEAVREYGFVPDFTLAAADGKIGHTMQLIVPADSPIKALEDLKDKRVAFVDMKSNSGYKAPLVILMNDYDLQPERDFERTFTHGHEISIRGIAANEYQAAPVASDMLARAVKRGEIKPEQYRVIHEAGPFPSAALGHVYNLHPDLVKAIKETFKDFPWAGSGLEREYEPAGIAKFVPADYKNQWTMIRRIEEALPARTDIPTETDSAEEEPAME